jgi:CO/xanthine dehydrogenase Mo-binding subunit
MIGRSITRIDAETKVCGTQIFIADLDVPGALLGATVRSTVAHGIIRSIKFDPSFPWKTLTAITAENFPGKNEVAMIRRDYPALAAREVRFKGEAVVLLAAPDPGILDEARRAITVEVDELPASFTIEDSLAKKAIVKEPDNILAQWTVSRGDVAKGMRDSDAVIEGEYRTGPVEHAYLETNGVVAVPRNGGIEVTGSIQCPYYVHGALVNAFGLPGDRVVVRQAATGGAFGGKEDFPSVLAVHAAALAMASGRPVRLLLERNEDILASSKRHPSIVRHRTGVRKDGTLVASEITMLLDGGAYATMSPVVLQRGVLHATGPYRCPNVRITGKAVATHHVPRGAFRGFGTPQAIFAVERHMDRIAGSLGLDPFEIRERNAVVAGDVLATGQVLKESVAARLVLDRAARLADFRKKWRVARGGSATVRRGVGLTLYFHGGAFTGSGEMRIKGKAAVRLADDGESVDVLASTVEMGQGYATVIAQIAAATLQVDISRVRMVTPDTSCVPDSGPTVASRSTMVVGGIVKRACESLLLSLRKLVAYRCKLDLSVVRYAGGAFVDNKGARLETFASAGRKYLESGGGRVFEAVYEPPPGHRWDEETMQGDAYPCYAWAADVIEVEVDMDTFHVTPVKATLVFDAGKAINPRTAAGQFEGGTLQSIGYATIEEMKYGGGTLLNDRLTNYIIPTAADCPEYETEIVEIPYSHGPFGAKGIGELPCDGAAPALAAAVENATGLPIESIPVTPEKLLEAWLTMRTPAPPARRRKTKGATR